MANMPPNPNVAAPPNLEAAAMAEAYLASLLNPAPQIYTSSTDFENNATVASPIETEAMITDETVISYNHKDGTVLSTTVGEAKNDVDDYASGRSKASSLAGIIACPKFRLIAENDPETAKNMLVESAKYTSIGHSATKNLVKVTAEIVDKKNDAKLCSEVRSVLTEKIKPIVEAPKNSQRLERPKDELHQNSLLESISDKVEHIGPPMHENATVKLVDSASAKYENSPAPPKKNEPKETPVLRVDIVKKPKYSETELAEPDVAILKPTLEPSEKIIEHGIISPVEAIFDINPITLIETKTPLDVGSIDGIPIVEAASSIDPTDVEVENTENKGLATISLESFEGYPETQTPEQEGDLLKPMTAETDDIPAEVPVALLSIECVDDISPAIELLPDSLEIVLAEVVKEYGLDVEIVDKSIQDFLAKVEKETIEIVNEFVFLGTEPTEHIELMIIEHFTELLGILGVSDNEELVKKFLNILQETQTAAAQQAKQQNNSDELHEMKHGVGAVVSSISQKMAQLSAEIARMMVAAA